MSLVHVTAVKNTKNAVEYNVFDKYVNSFLMMVN